MISQCPNCGEDDLPSRARFCFNCGVNLAVALEDDERTVQMPPFESIDDEGTKKLPQVEAVIDKEEIKDLPGTKTAGDEEKMKSPFGFELSGEDATISLTGVEEADIDERTKSLLGIEKRGEETTISIAKLEVVGFDEETKSLPRDEPAGEGETKGHETDLRVDRDLQGRYRLNQVLGKGGFGAVYLADDLRLNRLCVVKRMLTKGKSGRALKLYQANFEQEAKLLAALNEPGHPNIPEIYDYFSDESGNYLVMKHVEGRNLKEVLEQN